MANNCINAWLSKKRNEESVCGRDEVLLFIKTQNTKEKANTNSTKVLWNSSSSCYGTLCITLLKNTVMKEKSRKRL